MPEKDMPEQGTTEKDKVLSANLEFYRAFTLRDVTAMEALWARTLPVSCVHPGWMALRDRDAVMASWRDILANPEAPRVMCHDEDAVLYGDFAIVTCEEALESNTLVATNIFAREDDAWRLIHHQAGPLLMRAGHGGSGANRLN
jgi:predicted nuclease with RNAse H fold